MRTPLSSPDVRLFDLYIAIFALICEIVSAGVVHALSTDEDFSQSESVGKGRTTPAYGISAVLSILAPPSCTFLGRPVIRSGQVKVPATTFYPCRSHGTDHLMLYTRQAREVNRIQKSTPSVATVN